MFPVWLITTNYQKADHMDLKNDLKKIEDNLKKVGRYVVNITNFTFNLFMRPCSTQNQIEEARLAEIKLRRRMSIL